jgi:hypothetical protein
MSQFNEIDLDLKIAEHELAEFKEFLQQNAYFGEREVVKHLKARQHLSCLIGALIAGIPRANVYKFEFQILGAFKADLVVGNSQLKRFVLVEFESGLRSAIMGRAGTAQMRDWSKEIGHGFGQLIDWGWALSEQNRLLKNAFGCDPTAQFLLVCGRDSGMDVTDQARFLWRADHVRVGDQKATCLTYDGLMNFFQSTIEAIKSYHDAEIANVSH